MSKEQIEEMCRLVCNACEFGCGFNGLCSEDYDYRKCNNARETALALFNAGYRKQIEGEWITKHRHRGGFRTVTVVDSFGEKHTGTVDDRWECDDLYCSVCGKIAHDAFLNYCANCGAKMKGGE